MPTCGSCSLPVTMQWHAAGLKVGASHWPLDGDSNVTPPSTACTPNSLRHHPTLVSVTLQEITWGSYMVIDKGRKFSGVGGLVPLSHHFFFLFFCIEIVRNWFWNSVIHWKHANKIVQWNLQVAQWTLFSELLRGSSVIIVIVLGLDKRGVRFPAAGEDFYHVQSVQIGLGAQPVVSPIGSGGVKYSQLSWDQTTQCHITEEPYTWFHRSWVHKPRTEMWNCSNVITQDATGVWRKLHCERLHTLYSSLNIFFFDGSSSPSRPRSLLQFSNHFHSR